MDILRALVPTIVMVLDLAIAFLFLQDLYKPERRVSGEKNIWALIILFGSVIGWVAYMYYGREE